MDIAIVDCRRYGKQRRYYVLKSEGWKEVKRGDFVSESIAVFLERSRASGLCGAEL